jgi:hypothetical protein
MSQVVTNVGNDSIVVDQFSHGEGKELKRKLRNYAIWGGVIALVSILFFPLLLLGVILKLCMNPDKWDWTDNSVEIAKYSRKLCLVVFVITLINAVIWFTINFILMFFIIGIVTFLLYSICLIVFVYTVVVPLEVASEDRLKEMDLETK